MQCIMQALAEVASQLSHQADHHLGEGPDRGRRAHGVRRAPRLSSAKNIVRTAIDNYPNRGKTAIPHTDEALIAGFSHEYVRYMQGGLYRGSFRPLNDAVVAGRIRGLAGVVGCNNARVTQDAATVRDHRRAHPQRRAGGGHGLRRHGGGQVRLPAARVHGAGGRGPARGVRGHRHPARAARRARAWTTRAS